jgi:hypothetical protein
VFNTGSKKIRNLGAERELFRPEESISGLVPGNPKMKATRPTAERLLSQFDNLHLLIECKWKKISAVMVEGLTTLQKKSGLLNQAAGPSE